MDWEGTGGGLTPAMPAAEVFTRFRHAYHSNMFPQNDKAVTSKVLNVPTSFLSGLILHNTLRSGGLHDEDSPIFSYEFPFTLGTNLMVLSALSMFSSSKSVLLK